MIRFLGWGKLDWCVYGSLALLLVILASGAYSYDHPTANAHKHSDHSYLAPESAKENKHNAPRLENDSRYEARDSDAPKVRIVPQLRDSWDIAVLYANVFIAFLATMGTIFTGISLYLLKRQVIVSVEQRIAMQDTLAAINRQAKSMEEQTRHIEASVNVTRDALTATKDKERARIALEILTYKFGDEPRFSFSITCFGTTPATIKSTWHLCDVLPISDIGWPTAQIGSDLWQLPSVLGNQTFPQETFIAGNEASKPTSEVTKAIERGDLYLYFRCRIVYEDIFGTEQIFAISKVFGIEAVKRDAIQMLGSIYSDWQEPPKWYDSKYKYGEY